LSGGRPVASSAKHGEEPDGSVLAERHPRRIDWRYMLPSLKRKPGACAVLLRDAMFPRSEYAQAWELIRFIRGLAAPVGTAAPPFAESSA
jgi:hypothetical protein